MTLDANKNDEKLLTTIQREYKILAEYKMIESEKLSGIYVIPSYANSLLWFGVLFGRKGFYEDAVFRFTILLPDKFPDDKNLLTIIFQQDIIHPHVCPYTHSLDITNAFPVWHTGEDHIWQVLKYMQAIFADPLASIRNITSDLNNPEAAELLTQNHTEFLARIKQCVEKSKTQLYEPPPTEDPHYIVFEKFKPEIHGPVLERIRRNKISAEVNANQAQTNGSSGLSWVKEGESKPLSVE